MLKKYLLYLMAMLYALAGINHFIHPEMYLAIIPPWLPAPGFLVLISGIAELLLAFLLVNPGTRRVAAWGLICLLLAVFPANIQMALNYANDNHPLLWVALLRLPLQGALIWWAYQYTGK